MDMMLWVKFFILFFDLMVDYIIWGVIMLNIIGEECVFDICLFNYIYSDSVFFLIFDGLKFDFILCKGKYVLFLEDVK